ncbi:MAG: carboxymuconolactone decarboxylase family protein [Armatimonadota bacterium]|nr:carboxymuconolactone decarboxylase family protein [bacterium]
MLAPKTRDLIAIAASVVAKCQLCLDYHVEEARKAGASDSDMKNAISIARVILKTGNDKMDAYSDEKLGAMAEQDRLSGFCCKEERCCG